MITDTKSADQNLISVIKQRAIEKSSDWIYLNRLWHDPVTRSQFYSSLQEFSSKFLNLDKNSVLLCPEGIYSSFGIIPFAALLAQSVGCFLVIWKEFGDVVTARPKLFPDIEKFSSNARVVLFQDVISNGTILRKLTPVLQERNWNLHEIFSVIYLEQASPELGENLEYTRSVLKSPDMKFTYMVDGRELGVSS